MNRKTLRVRLANGLLLARGLQAQPEDDQAAIERAGFDGVHGHRRSRLAATSPASARACASPCSCEGGSAPQRLDLERRRSQAHGSNR